MKDRLSLYNKKIIQNHSIDLSLIVLVIRLMGQEILYANSHTDYTHLHHRNHTVY